MVFEFLNKKNTSFLLFIRSKEKVFCEKNYLHIIGFQYLLQSKKKYISFYFGLPIACFDNICMWKRENLLWSSSIYFPLSPVVLHTLTHACLMIKLRSKLCEHYESIRVFVPEILTKSCSIVLDLWKRRLYIFICCFSFSPR